MGKMLNLKKKTKTKHTKPTNSQLKIAQFLSVFYKQKCIWRGTIAVSAPLYIL